jgi:hypothetical protein
MSTLRCIVVLFACVVAHAHGQNKIGPDINDVLMHSTFRIFGPSATEATKQSTGTCFLVGMPMPTNPGRSWFVLVTAKHVLEGISGQTATMVVRQRTADAPAGYTRMTYSIQIRKGTAPLWTAHPSVDLAAMYITLPIQAAATVQIATIKLLATDDIYKQLEVHPGDELSTLGFPHGVEGPLGFPILRKGTIASYPLGPASAIKSILLDIEVIPGNSGGPVYYGQIGRYFAGRWQPAARLQFIAGVLTAQVMVGQTSIRLASVIPAQFIQETIALLPPR